MSQCGNRLDDVDVWVAMVALAIRWSWSATMLGVVPMVGSICSSKLADTASREMIGAHVDYLGLDVPPDRQLVVGHRRQADQLNADWITRLSLTPSVLSERFPR